MRPSRVLVLLIGLPGLTLAQVCSDIEDDTKRLACYDAKDKPSSTVVSPGPLTTPAEQPVVPAPAEAPPPASHSRAETKVAAGAPEDFGKKEPLDAPKEYIEARIAKITTAGGFDYLRLDNGQLWRESDWDSRVRFKEGRKVTITEGVLGSYDLKMEGRNKIVKVKRVQ